MGAAERQPRLCRRLPDYRGDASGLLAGAEAMLECVAAIGQPVMRWSVTTPPAIYLGASQKPSALDAAVCRAAGIAAYQRAAGGMTVLGDEALLGLDIALPAGDPLVLSDLTLSYRWLGEVWSEALRDLGVPAHLVSMEQARAQARDTSEGTRLARLACYGALSPFEVTLHGRKLVGLAQVRRRAGALFQPAILLHWNPAVLSRLLAVPDDERAALSAALATRAIGLDDGAARKLPQSAIIDAVESRLIAHGLRPEASEWTPAEQALARQLVSEKYQPISLSS